MVELTCAHPLASPVASVELDTDVRIESPVFAEPADADGEPDGLADDDDDGDGDWDPDGDAESVGSGLARHPESTATAIISTKTTAKKPFHKASNPSNAVLEQTKPVIIGITMPCQHQMMTV